MLPNNTEYELEEEIENDFEEESYADRTYKLDFENRSISSLIDETEAKKQAVIKIIMTENEKYPIYGFDYGTMLDDLIGEQPPYVQNEVKERLETAILSDDRFSFVEFDNEEYRNGKYILDVVVTCAEGEEIELEGVEINV